MRISEVRNPAIKLFGQTIQVPLKLGLCLSNEPSPVSIESLVSIAVADNKELCFNHKLVPSATTSHKDSSQKEQEVKETSGKELSADTHQMTESTTSSGISEKPRTPSFDRENSLKTSKNGDQSSETSNSEEKIIKKPEKLLPCPRCNSKETKFCYYNNYNVNQPRHFCKNCQRYWTAGGTMRNVPVGAGRRKNRNSTVSQLRHVITPEILQTLMHHPSFGNNETVLTFSSQPAPWSPVDPPRTFCPNSGFPVPFYPTPAYLGKHSRDGIIFNSANSHKEEIAKENYDPERRLWIPKTLRIKDPSEAAKSSIWTTLGINNEKTSSINGGGLFKAFQSMTDKETHVIKPSPVLQANPAALSRSLNFHEIV